jgi:hypothetical protein
VVARSIIVALAVAPTVAGAALGNTGSGNGALPWSQQVLRLTP